MTKKSKMVRRCVVIDDATWKAVVEAARKDGRSASGWIRQSLDQALDLHDVIQADKDL